MSTFCWVHWLITELWLLLADHNCDSRNKWGSAHGPYGFGRRGVKINGHTTVTAPSHQSLPVCPAWCPVLPFASFSHCHATLGDGRTAEKMGASGRRDSCAGRRPRRGLWPRPHARLKSSPVFRLFPQTRGADCQPSPPPTPAQTLWRLGNSRLPWTHTHSP